MASVKEQTWREFEYIIIDGGSSDGSAEYIKENKSETDYYISESDRGIYNAMNKGIKASQGDYLLFLNSGDILSNKKVLELCSKKLDGEDVIYGHMRKIFPDGTEIVDKGIGGEAISLTTFIERTINHSSSFINKRLFNEYGLYDENLKIVSDWKFFLISLGMHNSVVKYLDFEISSFDMTGISNRELEVRNKERQKVLADEVPVPILADYEEKKELRRKLNSSRVILFEKVDKKKIPRKINSLLFKLFS